MTHLQLLENLILLFWAGNDFEIMLEEITTELNLAIALKLISDKEARSILSVVTRVWDEPIEDVFDDFLDKIDYLSY